MSYFHDDDFEYPDYVNVFNDTMDVLDNLFIWEWSEGGIEKKLAIARNLDKRQERMLKKRVRNVFNEILKYVKAVKDGKMDAVKGTEEAMGWTVNLSYSFEAVSD